MKAIAAVTMLTVLAFAATGSAKEEKAKGSKGEEIFNKQCVMCHPNGGNIMNAKKTLKKKDLEANKLKGAADLVSYMRNPGPGMTKFDAKTLPDKEAKEVAEYVLKTFK
ncbi:MAG: cytochrome C [Geobacter sp.]|nr:MAG: cytochrome C [Geobacter sp.]